MKKKLLNNYIFLKNLIMKYDIIKYKGVNDFILIYEKKKKNRRREARCGRCMNWGDLSLG